MKPLSRHEKWLKSLITCRAESPSGVRAALDKHGLTGLKRADIERFRRQEWRDFCKENQGIPKWVLALQFPTNDWRRRLPRGVKCGTLRECARLAYLAYEGIDFGKKRKHRPGDSNVFGCDIHEHVSSTSKWTWVSSRSVTYGCVLSPDGKQVAYSIVPPTSAWTNPTWEVVPCRGEWFRVRGDLVRLTMLDNKRYDIPLRTAEKLLREARFTCHLERRTSSGRKTSKRPTARNHLVLCVDFGEFGATSTIFAGKSIVAAMRNELNNRISCNKLGYSFSEGGRK